jgi:hypothetical protein
VCPPNGSQFGGLTAWTKLDSGVASTAHAGAQLRFTAPAGTTISQVRLRRDIGTRNDGYYVFRRTDAGQLAGETCAIPIDEFTCVVGGPAAPPGDFSAASTHS